MATAKQKKAAKKNVKGGQGGEKEKDAKQTFGDQEEGAGTRGRQSSEEKG